MLFVGVLLPGFVQNSTQHPYFYEKLFKTKQFESSALSSQLFLNNAKFKIMHPGFGVSQDMQIWKLVRWPNNLNQSLHPLFIHRSLAKTMNNNNKVFFFLYTFKRLEFLRLMNFEWCVPLVYINTHAWIKRCDLHFVNHPIQLWLDAVGSNSEKFKRFTICTRFVALLKGRKKRYKSNPHFSMYLCQSSRWKIMHFKEGSYKVKCINICLFYLFI